MSVSLHFSLALSIQRGQRFGGYKLNASVEPLLSEFLRALLLSLVVSLKLKTGGGMKGRIY